MFVGDLLLWMIVVPLIGSLITGIGGRKMNDGWIHGVGILTSGVALALTVKASLALDATHMPAIEHTVATWAASGIFHFDLGFMWDVLASKMALLITGVIFAGQLAVVQHRGENKSPARVVSLLNGLLAAGLVVLLADNLLLLFGGWCWMGLGLTACRDRAASPKDSRLFVMQRLGDVSFLVAILLLVFHCNGTTHLMAVSFLATKAGYGPFYDPYTLTIFCLLVLGAVASQVRLFPFHWKRSGTSWIDAFQSITAITASVYLLVRLSGLFTLSTTAMTVMAALGAVTALVAAVTAVRHSNVCNLLDRFWVVVAGMVLLALGVGAYSESVDYWMSSAGFGFLLCLVSPSVVGGAENVRSSPRRKWLLFLAFVFCFPLVNHMTLVGEIDNRSYRVPVPAKAVAVTSNGSSLLIAGEQGTVLSSDDGANWGPSRVPIATLNIRGSVALRWPNITGAAMAADGSAWAVSNHGIIYHRTDGRWTRQHSPENATEREALHAVLVLSETSVWFVGAEGRVLHYDGTTFQQSNVGTAVNLHAIAAKSATELYAGGDRGLIYRYDGTDWIQLPSVGSGRITAFAVASEGLYATTSRGALFHQVNDAWLEVPVDVVGVESMLAFNAIASSGDTLVLGGSVRQEGKAVPVILTQRDGQWSAATGQAGGVIQGLLVSQHGVQAVGTHGNGGSSRLWWPNDDDRLESAAQLPYRPGHHRAFPWIVGVAFLLLTFALLNFLLRSCTGGSESSAPDTEMSDPAESDLSVLSVFVAGATLVVHALIFGLLSSVGTGVIPEWMDINESIQTLLSVANSRLHLDPLGLDTAGVNLMGGFCLIAVLATIGRFPAVRRFGQRLARWLAPVDGAIAFVSGGIGRLPAALSWVLRGLARLIHRVLDQWIIGTLFVRLPAMLFRRAQEKGDVSEATLKMSFWSVVLALLWVAWLAGVSA